MASPNFNVKHGGLIRYSAVVSSSETSAWNKGRLLRLNTSGQWQIQNGSASSTVLTGMAMETRVLSTSVGPTTTLTKLPATEKYSAILDEAVVVTDELQSGVAFAAGDDLYCSTTGYVTTSGNSTGSNSPRIGKALTYANAGDTARPLEMFFSISY